MQKAHAPRNRTLSCTPDEIVCASQICVPLEAPCSDVENIVGKIFCQDFFTAAPFLPSACVDLLILDPPYNLTKNYGGTLFRARNAEAYQAWFTQMIQAVRPALRETATVYVCSDWRTSTLIFPILDRFFRVRNRITWEREKGRGAARNWKNNAEDIWFCTVGESYFFDVNAVKLRRRVLAPYRQTNGRPKDWNATDEGNFRWTHPSNLWTDLTVPFWSMPENTPHPTQKPEKWAAKLLLASSREGDLVLDPFSGSGTVPVVAKKLGRRFCGIEQNTEYCAWTLKRLKLAETSPEIQGFVQGFFRERNG